MMMENRESTATYIHFSELDLELRSRFIGPHTRDTSLKHARKNGFIFYILFYINLLIKLILFTQEKVNIK